MEETEYPEMTKDEMQRFIDQQMRDGRSWTEALQHRCTVNCDGLDVELTAISFLVILLFPVRNGRLEKLLNVCCSLLI